MGNVISDLAEGASKGLFSGLGSMFKDIRTALTGVDPVKAAEIEVKLTEMEGAIMAAQSEVNKVEAGNPSLFVSGWRPFIGWVCGLGIFLAFIAFPLFQWMLILVGSAAKLPALDTATIMQLVLGMLGLGGIRAWEKKSGVARI